MNQAMLEALALRYVERFATTRGKLSDYLTRKVRERGWDGAAPDVAALADRFAARGYVDDRGYAEAKAAALTRRGYGERRVAVALRAARVDADDSAPALTQARVAARESALAFARRRRFGRFAHVIPDDATRRRQFAAMLRAGHSIDLAREILSIDYLAIDEDCDAIDEDC